VKKIKNHAEVNLFLEKEYLPEHNRRFRRMPSPPEDYHRAAPRAGNWRSFSSGNQANPRQRLGRAIRQPHESAETRHPQRRKIDSEVNLEENYRRSLP
jgi:hypothetical protein